jgi:hypothetical protein
MQADRHGMGQVQRAVGRTGIQPQHPTGLKQLIVAQPAVLAAEHQSTPAGLR